jgi:uncharacterized protein YbjT (DUF2867 family)
MIVVTAPTGTIGRQVVDGLLARGESVRVIARDPDRLAEPVRTAVEVVPGSHGDPDTVARAFAGADAVFWLVPPDPKAAGVHEAYVDFTRPAAAAFAEQGVGRVVGVSALGRGTPQAAHAGYVTGSLAMDDLIASTGVPYRALTMPSFMDNLLRSVPLIRDQGVFFSPIAGDRKLPSCATRDIAAVAVDVLTDRSWSGFAEVPVLGPEDISFEDMARIISEVLGTPVRFQQIPAVALKERLTGVGMSDAMAQGNVDMALAKDAGLDNAVPRTPSSSTPTTFRQWCIEVLAPAVRAEQPCPPTASPRPT